jgi:Flp pilus assembly pilin Flp
VRDLNRRARRNGPQRGQTMAEYALVLAVITVGVLASVSALSGGIMSGIDEISGLVAGLV